jgi:hypothetical protein
MVIIFDMRHLDVGRRLTGCSSAGWFLVARRPERPKTNRMRCLGALGNVAVRNG